MKRLLLLIPTLALGLTVAVAADPSRSAVEKKALPSKFDLREHGFVTPVRHQTGGTCWTHGAMAAIESNLLRSGMWQKLNIKGLPNLAEYHLDWWNGFNQYRNDDIADAAKSKGLRVHFGGDYRVTAAYISRGDGAVYCPKANDGGRDAVWYKAAPPRIGPDYRRFYVRHIEWFTIGKNLEGIERIKERIMSHGAIGTAYCVSKSYLSKDFVHYQPPTEKRDPNHAVAIVGWDDAKVAKKPGKFKAPRPGAWLIKNSWGTKKGEKGYYWISYYDKHCCRHPEMGAVSFRDTEPLRYQHFYYHDYHGWRDTMPKVKKAFNAFTAKGRQRIEAVSFYTAADNASYTVRIYGKFEGGKLGDLRSEQSGSFAVTGMHTVDLDRPVVVQPGEKFYVYLELSAGGHAIDRTSQILVLLDPPPKNKGKKKRRPMPKPIVISKAQPGESYWWDGGSWRDLYDYDFPDPAWGRFDRTANFCMKALAVDAK